MKTHFFPALIFIFFYNCEKNNSNIEYLNYELLEFNACVSCSKFRDSELVIQDSVSYQLLQDTIMACYHLCENLQFPKTDFSRYSLLGKYTGVGACYTSYERVLFLDKINQSYTYKITIEYSGGCDSKREHMNWIKVQKLNTAFPLDFQVKYINLDN